MSKRGLLMLVLVLAAGCNNDTEPTITPEEQQAVRQYHGIQNRQQGSGNEITYVAWEGVTVPDIANTPVRVLRVKFKVGAQIEPMDVLYRLNDGHVIKSRLNGSGDQWQPEAQVWVRGKP